MTSPSLALQKLVYARLVNSAEVTALVSRDFILDRSGRPTAFPCIIIGEGYGNLGTYWYEGNHHDELFSDLHIWTAEPSTVEVKEIAHAIRLALRGYPWSAPGYTCHDLSVAGETFMRDPDGLHAHGVVSVRAILQERASA
ncbi:Protein of unknown function [Kaistia soli DSM 19436]|uniref:DUF3168 domain-containing protein n=1 Tax=Kaistia soli DSM 19436 TaxID=1122133 RepID=A0A1M5PPN8_9HYPH|nr:DUF3168 domain-containing protein [Kaistia soli]SHH03732.1 Protein of unknown function [Kaistia soli DSM 19436]